MIRERKSGIEDRMTEVRGGWNDTPPIDRGDEGTTLYQLLSLLIGRASVLGEMGLLKARLTVGYDTLLLGSTHVTPPSDLFGQRRGRDHCRRASEEEKRIEEDKTGGKTLSVDPCMDTFRTQ